LFAVLEGRIRRLGQCGDLICSYPHLSLLLSTRSRHLPKFHQIPNEQGSTARGQHTAVVEHCHCSNIAEVSTQGLLVRLGVAQWVRHVPYRCKPSMIDFETNDNQLLRYSRDNASIPQSVEGRDCSLRCNGQCEIQLSIACPHVNGGALINAWWGSACNRNPSIRQARDTAHIQRRQRTTSTADATP